VTNPHSQATDSALEIRIRWLRILAGCVTSLAVKWFHSLNSPIKH